MIFICPSQSLEVPDRYSERLVYDHMVDMIFGLGCNGLSASLHDSIISTHTRLSINGYVDILQSEVTRINYVSCYTSFT